MDNVANLSFPSRDDQDVPQQHSIPPTACVPSGLEEHPDSARVQVDSAAGMVWS